METLKTLGVALWSFVTNPPTEVGKAGIAFLNGTAKCLAEQISTLATTVIDSFKGIF